ncbi:hypothetical protein SAMN06273572_10224 [Monaibacterium marinum]|uniref:Uncharacterized protein n=1 Tax=Pontivivens marinum TaxID=1690039 RepID=A0A2C9CQ35_9RHOB|nr:hypothetical protein [Monaibacterium marinum]SOH93348.1 hypothetical protein SAMN06273572_10224 [Monaibacterium marinum]
MTVLNRAANGLTSAAAMLFIAYLVWLNAMLYSTLYYMQMQVPG